MYRFSEAPPALGVRLPALLPLLYIKEGATDLADTHMKRKVTVR